MTAFGIGELSGIISGFTLGHAWIVTLKTFFGLIVASIILFGVWYWNEQFNRSDVVKSFIDFVKPAVWFIYISAVSYLFFTTYTGKLEFYPAFVDERTFTKGIQVVTPDGKKELVDADSPYKTYSISGIPLLYSLLEPADALEVVLITNLILSADKTGWDGYFANELSPSKIFSKCIFNAINSHADKFKAWLCSNTNFGESSWGYRIGTNGFCSGVSAGDVTVIDNEAANCIMKYQNKLFSVIDRKIEELNKLKDEGKIDNQTYAQKEEELIEAKRKLVKLFSSLTNAKTLNEYKHLFIAKLFSNISEDEKALVKRVVTNNDFTFVKSIMDWIGKQLTHAFVGEYLLLDLFESYQKFALTVELGFLLPALFLLSMLPDAGSPTGSRIKLAFYGVGVYFLIKLMRVFVFLIYLLLHNYFLQNAVG